MYYKTKRSILFKDNLSNPSNERNEEVGEPYRSSVMNTMWIRVVRKSFLSDYPSISLAKGRKRARVVDRIRNIQIGDPAERSRFSTRLLSRRVSSVYSLSTHHHLCRRGNRITPRLIEKKIPLMPAFHLSRPPTVFHDTDGTHLTTRVAMHFLAYGRLPKEGIPFLAKMNADHLL